ncbi:hypothetical protein TNCV_3832311 [Trichonephila clavipes]|nr:hypothetical protein TNCV_3832311 [Trichonephila clavipes]
MTCVPTIFASRESINSCRDRTRNLGLTRVDSDWSEKEWPWPVSLAFGMESVWPGLSAFALNSEPEKWPTN